VNRKQEILDKVQHVPSLPAVVIELRQYLNDPDVSFEKLARIIEYDPGLTANVLQLANSPYFSWSRRISSVKEAVIRLGVTRVYQMVLAMSVAPIISKQIRGYGMEANQLWEHSIAVAIGAEQLGATLAVSGAQDAFTVGLLHDVGKVVLGTFVEIDDEPIKELVALDGLAFNEAEKQVLGIDHAEVGKALLERWNLPEEVVNATAFHHTPDAYEGDTRLLDLVHVVDVLCMKVGWGMGEDGLLYRLSEPAARRLGMRVEVGEEVICKVMQGLEELRVLYAPQREGELDGVQHSTR
jgi:putative nucleotidyltransferase with HDIG domain